MREVTESNPGWKKIFEIVIALVIIALVVGGAVYPVLFQSWMASGPDTGSHLCTAKFLVDFFRVNHRLPHINPNWYCGFEVLHNTPRLTYLPLGLLYWLTGDILLAGRLYHWLLLVAIGAGMFVVLRSRSNLGGAIFGAILFPLAPIIFLQIVGEGSYTQSLSLVFYPLAFLAFENVLDQKRPYLNLILLTVALAFSILAHPAVGAAFLVFLTLYLVIRLVLDRKTKLVSIWQWMLAVMITLGLVAHYLLPFFGERIGRVAVPEVTAEMYSIPFHELFGQLGPVLLIFALLVLWERRPERAALLLTSVFSAALSIGVFLPFSDLLPLKNFYPATFLGAAAVGLSYLAGLSLPALQKRLGTALWPTILIVVSITFMGYGGYQYSSKAMRITAKYYSYSSLKVPVELVSKLEALPDSGRVMPMKYPFGNLLWWLTNDSDRPLVEGMYYGTNPIGKHLAWIYDAIDHGYPKRAVQKLSLMNTSYLITNKNFRGEPYLRFLEQMEKEGFVKEAEVDGYALYFQEGESRDIQLLDPDILVIGKHAPVLAALLDSAVAGGSPVLDDYDLSFLKHFKVLALTGIDYSNKSQAEKLIRSYLRAGGKVVIDMVGQKKSLIEENPSFFGVSAYPQSTDKQMVLELHDSLAKQVRFKTLTLDLPAEIIEGKKTKLKEWRYLTYLGMDEAVATIGGEGEFYGLIGYKNIPEGKILFAGPNLFYHAFLTHDSRELQLTGQLLEPKRKTARYQVEVEQELLEPEHIKFRYTSDGKFPLLVSFAYSPHWKAWLDGKPIKVFNLEDLLALSLPEGEHTVELKYTNTAIHYVGNSISLLALVLLGWLFWLDASWLKRQ